MAVLRKCLTMGHHNKCVLSSDKILMALVAVFQTELLSAQVAVIPASASQSNFLMSAMVWEKYG